MTPASALRLLEAPPLDAPASRFGEGPEWDVRTGSVIWTDVDRHRLHAYNPSSGASRTVTVDFAINGLWEPDRPGNAPRFPEVRRERGDIQLVAEIKSDKAETRMNDGKCDRAGRFWAGAVAHDASRGAGCLYRLSPSGAATPMLEGVTVSNGLAWNADDSLMYYVDTAERRIDVFDFDLEAGTITGRRPFVHIPPTDGMPDGITIDANDHVWVAL